MGSGGGSSVVGRTETVYNAVKLAAWIYNGRYFEAVKERNGISSKPETATTYRRYLLLESASLLLLWAFWVALEVDEDFVDQLDIILM